MGKEGIEVCRNRLTGQYFVYVQESGTGEMLLVTPEGKIKSLKADLFNDIEDKSEYTLLENSLITEEQVMRFQMYQENRNEEVLDNLLIHIEKSSPTEQKAIIEKLQNIADKRKGAVQA